MKGKIFVISGPSGTGKTTLLEKLIKSRDLKYRVAKSVSFTTRAKRSGERAGRDYFFISQQEFLKKRQAKKFLEWTKYLGYYYATSKDFIAEKLRKGKDVLLCLDLKGALKIRQLYPKNTVTIFILPPSLEALRERIEKRCRKTKKEEILKRLKLARQELAISRRYDYCLVNKNLERTVKDLEEIILREQNL